MQRPEEKKSLSSLCLYHMTHMTVKEILTYLCHIWMGVAVKGRQNLLFLKYPPVRMHTSVCLRALWVVERIALDTARSTGNSKGQTYCCALYHPASKGRCSNTHTHAHTLFLKIDSCKGQRQSPVQQHTHIHTLTCVHGHIWQHFRCIAGSCWSWSSLKWKWNENNQGAEQTLIIVMSRLQFSGCVVAPYVYTCKQPSVRHNSLANWDASSKRVAVIGWQLVWLTWCGLWV